MNKQQSFLWTTLIRVILFWLATVASFAAASSVFKNNLSSALAAVGVSLLLTFLFARWQKMNLNETGIVPGNKTIPKFLLGILIGSALAGLQAMVVSSTGHIRIVPNNEIPVHIILTFLLLFFLLACREELAFHGFALRSLQSTSGMVVALAVTCSLFIIEHIIGGMGWWSAIWGSGIGALLFGMAALVSRGLALPIGIHFAWNAMQWVLGFKNKGGLYRTIIEKGYEAKLETVGSISYVVVMGLAIIVFLFYWKKKRKQSL
jgi:membrane protease YdiL (CAAX protease family)